MLGLSVRYVSMPWHGNVGLVRLLRQRKFRRQFCNRDKRGCSLEFMLKEVFAVKVGPLKSHDLFKFQ